MIIGKSTVVKPLCKYGIALMNYPIDPGAKLILVINWQNVPIPVSEGKVEVKSHWFGPSLNP